MDTYKTFMLNGGHQVKVIKETNLGLYSHKEEEKVIRLYGDTILD